MSQKVSNLNSKTFHFLFTYLEAFVFNVGGGLLALFTPTKYLQLFFKEEPDELAKFSCSFGGLTLIMLGLTQYLVFAHGTHFLRYWFLVIATCSEVVWCFTLLSYGAKLEYPFVNSLSILLVFIMGLMGLRCIYLFFLWSRVKSKKSARKNK
eukprot:TRINITY_DN3589_c0_g1_i1.p1 TRINITY_DN3589_c0_g1~~TRINITY_DN3589_c0_g1_i1.p1  ORF type:complete len:152 (-),score=10.19 TRINITY_DN3589_c0_g1_i1:4-459(-)